MLLFLTLETKHLILGATELLLGSVHLELCLVHDPLCFLQIGLAGSCLGLQLLFFLGQLFQLIGTAQDAGFLVHRTAGHGTTGIHHLTIQGYDLEAIAELLCSGNCSVDILSDNDSAQEVVHDTTVAVIAGNKLRCDAHITTAVFNTFFIQGLTLDHRDGQEGCATATGAFQISDGRLGILLIIHNDLLHSATQSDLDGNGIFVVGADQAGYRSMDIPQSAPLALLHDHTNRLLITFKIPLHGTEYTDLCLNAVKLGVHFPKLLLQFVTALDTALLTEAITGNGIVGCGDLCLRGTKFFLAGFPGFPSLFLTGGTGFQVAV